MANTSFVWPTFSFLHSQRMQPLNLGPFWSFENLLKAALCQGELVHRTSGANKVRTGVSTVFSLTGSLPGYFWLMLWLPYPTHASASDSCSLIHIVQNHLFWLCWGCSEHTTPVADSTLDFCCTSQPLSRGFSMFLSGLPPKLSSTDNTRLTGSCFYISKHLGKRATCEKTLGFTQVTPPLAVSISKRLCK